MRTRYKLGWVRDLPDKRDYLWQGVLPVMQNLPETVDLSTQCPPVYNQGDLGSCTANSIAGAIEFDLIKEKKSPVVPSRLFVYYNERVIEGTTDYDSGAQIRDGMKAISKCGYVDETLWPYTDSKLTVRPPANVYTAAGKNLVKQYVRVPQTKIFLKSAIASNCVVCFGFTVYESFMSDEVAKTGIMPMPSPGESVVGGHAVLLVGYDEAKSQFIVRNSWGNAWGQAGYFYMPYDYALDGSLSSDFWNVKTV